MLATAIPVGNYRKLNISKVRTCHDAVVTCRLWFSRAQEMESMKGCTDPPPPIPATARAAIKAPIEEARPHNIVPDPEANPSPYTPKKDISVIPNRVSASNIAPFRPRISAKRPRSEIEHLKAKYVRSQRTIKGCETANG